MKNMIYSLLLVFLPIVLHAGGGDAQSYTLPPCFIHNAGQWESGMRYALLGGNGSVWFRDDGIVIARPRTSKPSPSEELHAVAEEDNMFEVLYLRFINSSSRMRLRARDTLSSVTHFYLGRDSAHWRDHVSNHSGVRYENLWDGVDLEFDFSGEAEGEGWKELAPGGGSHPAILVRETVAGAIAQHRIELSGGVAHEARYLQPEALSTYMTFIGSAHIGTVRSEGPYIYLYGEATSPEFRTFNAWKGVMPGRTSQVLVKYIPESRSVVYSTYLGPTYQNIPTITPFTGTQSSTFASRSNRSYIFISSGGEFPITHALQDSEGPGAVGYGFPEQAVLLALDTAGMLLTSTYVGGPGMLTPQAVSICREEIYIFGVATGDSSTHIRAITADALEPISPNTSEPTHLSTRHAGVFGILNPSIDTLRYMTYIFPSSKARRMDQTSSLRYCMHVSEADGSAIFLFEQNGAGIPNAPLRNSLISSEDIYGKAGVYIAKYSRMRNDYEYATWYGYKDRDFKFHSSYLRENGDLFLAGVSAPWFRLEREPASLPGQWKKFGSDSLDHHSASLVLGCLDAQGRSRGGCELWFRGDMFGSTGLQEITETMCDHILVRGCYSIQDTMRRIDRFPMVNAFDTASVAYPSTRWDQYLVSVDANNLDVSYSSYWNHQYTRRQAFLAFHMKRPNGYVMYSNMYAENEILPTPDWRILGSQADTGSYMVDIRIPTPCWRLGCDIRAVDTLRIEKVRGYSEPRVIEVEYLVPNLSPEKAARILQAMIELPPGCELIGGTPVQPMVPSELYAGNTARCFWRVRVLNPAVLGDTARIRCRVMYIDPESGQTWPIAEEVCEHIMHVVRYDEADPRLSCTVEGPDSLYWTDSGYASEPGGEVGLIRYTATYTNVSGDTVDVMQYRQSASAFCRVVRNGIIRGNILPPGDSYSFSFDVRLDALRYDRRIVIRTAAVDGHGLSWSDCEKTTYVPGIHEIPCTVAGPDKIVWNTATGTPMPASPSYTLTLDNPLDTIRVDIRARLDLALAQHLAPAAGEQLLRDPFNIAAHAQEQRSWQLELSNPPTRPTADTLYFFYTVDGATYYCTKVVEIDVIDQTVLCSIAAPQALTEQQLENHENVQFDYTLSNVGTVPVSVTRIDLAISPTSAVLVLDPLSQPGGTIAPSGNINGQWRLRPLALRQDRTAHFDVTAYGAADSILSVCTHDLYLPGIDGLLCAITSPDSVRFIRDPLRYDPDPVPVRLDLRNILDTEETQIEAEIDLANTPRFELATSETAIKTLASIDSNGTAQLQWLLHPLPDTLTEAQDITIRYRSLEQAEWKECNAEIIIEAYPHVQTTHCVVSGHDSLHIDPFYERIIPEPFEISYTATNTGTVALHNCAATIILPPEFELVSGTATLSFGDLLPNNSCTRWWSLKTTAALSDTGTYPLSFTWRSDEQGSVAGCEHRVHVIATASNGIVFTPLHLHFEAEQNDPIPAAQYVDLWTGGGLSMPWTAQGGQWWLDADPATGDHAARIAVQPTTTALPVGLHTTAISIAGQAPNLPRDVAVTYEITGLVGVESGAAPAAFGLGPVWPQPVPLNGEARISISVPPGEYVRLTIHDALGREVAVLHDGVMPEQDRILRFTPSTHRMSAGMYFLRLSSGAGEAVRVVVVRP